MHKLWLNPLVPLSNWVLMLTVEHHDVCTKFFYLHFHQQRVQTSNRLMNPSIATPFHLYKSWWLTLTQPFSLAFNQFTSSSGNHQFLFDGFNPQPSPLNASPWTLQPQTNKRKRKNALGELFRNFQHFSEALLF